MLEKLSNYFTRQKLKEWGIVLVITLITIELTLQAAVRLGYSDLSLPSYSTEYATPFWQVLDKDFGAWHPANARYSHRKTCFEHIYTSNSHGMRDAETPVKSSAPRVVVLGDSFVEGYAVDYGQRFTERLEALTDLQFLNFGTGGFGSTQSYVLYKTLASKFDHRAVILGFVPTLDFHRNTPNEPALQQGAEYRPYLVGDYPNYEFRYPPNGFPPGYEWRRWASAALSEYWLTYRSRFHVGAMLRDQFPSVVRFMFGRLQSAHADPDPTLNSAYYVYSPDGMARLRYVIEQIKAAAGDRPMLVFTIPLSIDYRRDAAHPGGTPPLTAELKALAAKNGFEYVDFLEETRGTDWLNLFPSCDGHWSERGHQMAAERFARWSALQRGARAQSSKSH